MRWETLAARMTCDAAVVCHPVNRRYLTGFSSSAGTLFVTKKEAFLLVDSRYIEAASAINSGCTVLLEEDLPAQLQALVGRCNINSVGMETHYTSFALAQRMAQMIMPAQLLPDDDFCDLLLSMRSIKEPGELACLRKAQEITDAAFAATLGQVRPGISELEIMMTMGNEMARLGCEKRAFNMILTSGRYTSLPHGDPAIRTIEAGDLVMMDVGAMVGGYSADMTRTFAVGHVSQEQREVYHTVLQAQEAALAAIRPGVSCCSVDRVARDYIDASAYAGMFGHGLGHSLGLEIHENPRLNPVFQTLLQPGMVMTVEPGIYLPGKFGVRIEDMIVVTEDGYENYTHTPKTLTVI